MKNVLLIAFLTVIGTVAWAQRETIQNWMEQTVKVKMSPTNKDGTQKIAPENSKISKTVNVVQDDSKPTVELSAMLAAFDKILGLSEEQKSHVLYENEKTFERINEVRQRLGIDNAWKEQEINRLKAFRDKRVVSVLDAKQLDKWNNFVQGKEAINSLKKTNETKVPYERGEKKFYPESEYGEFTSLEQIQSIIADKKTIIAASGFSADEIEQLYSIINQF
ncbi:MAG: hypothetical protein JNM36_17675 [Chitinophagales bacterium]|mgnify:FL=1|nr:hypothetical protein [Chitinophagales bacterium]